MDQYGAIIVHSACAYVVLLSVQTALTIILALLKHDVVGLAAGSLVYALIWPCVGACCGNAAEIIGICFGFAMCMAQIAELLRLSDGGTAVIALASVAFVACCASITMSKSCTFVINHCYANSARTNHIDDLPSAHVVVSPQPRLTPPPAAVVTLEPSLNWVTVISPNNHIDVARK